MSVFVDTSAFLALLDASDQFHTAAATVWRRLLESESRLVTSSYVLVETFALTQNRLGPAASRTFERDILPTVEVIWIDQDLHRSSVAAFLAAARRRLSLVDCVSFEVMRANGISRAFAFDRHFAEQGFSTT